MQGFLSVVCVCVFVRLCVSVLFPSRGQTKSILILWGHSLSDLRTCPPWTCTSPCAHLCLLILHFSLSRVLWLLISLSLPLSPCVSRPDEREAVQKKTFVKWVNSHLSRVSCRITDLYMDLRDGRMLIKLLEVLSGERLVGHVAVRAFNLKEEQEKWNEIQTLIFFLLSLSDSYWWFYMFGGSPNILFIY